MKKILVWIPLPPAANWRGEGIAQTLEQWLVNFGEDIHFDLFVNANTAECLDESLFGKVSYKLHCYQLSGRYSLFGGRPETIVDLNVVDKRLGVFGYFGQYAKRFLGYKAGVQRIVSLVLYSVILRAATFLYSKKLIFRGSDLVWAPVPAVPFVESLEGKRIYNFWDPFVLEYSEFDAMSPIFITKFKRMFLSDDNSAIVVTQSMANRDYVSAVFRMPKDRVRVVRLGCPDYKPYVEPIADVISEFKNRKTPEIIRFWPNDNRYVVTGSVDRGQVIRKRNHLIEQHSVFFRLARNIQTNSKIVFISTQDRPYKGLALVFKALAQLKEVCSSHRLHIVTTCKVPPDIKKLYPHLFEAIVEFRRLPNKNHAFVTAISDLVLHPSFVEGGLGSYSMFEAASVGVPSLTNIGRHTEELKLWVGDSVETAFADFTDIRAVTARMKELLFDDTKSQEVVRALQEAGYSWCDSSRALANVFNNWLS